MDELRRAAAALLDHPPAAPPSVTELHRRNRRRRARRRLAATSVTAIVLLAGVAVAAARPEDPAPPERVTATPDTERRDVLAVAVPEGVLLLDEGGKRTIVPASNTRGLAWSPDGRTLLVEAVRQRFLVDRDGTNKRRVAVDGDAAGQWLDADTFVVYDGEEHRYRRVEAGRPGESTPFLPAARFVVWSANGRHLAYLDDQGRLYVARGDGTGVRRIRPSSGLPTGSLGIGSVSPDGRWVAVQVADARQTYLTLVATTPDRTTVGFGAFNGSVQWSPDGRSFAWVHGTGSGVDQQQVIDVCDASVHRCRNVEVPVGRSAFAPVWSPDGTKLAFDVVPNGERKLFTEIWDRARLWVADTGTLVGREVRGAGAGAGLPQWTADSRAIVHVLVAQLGRGRLVVDRIPARGGGATRLLTWGSGPSGQVTILDPARVVLATAWSPAEGG